MRSYEDAECFQKYLRMSPQLFDLLHGKIKLSITHENTVMRETIPSETR